MTNLGERYLVRHIAEYTGGQLLISYPLKEAFQNTKHNRHNP